MKIERHGAKRLHRTVTLAHRPAWPLVVGDANFVYLIVSGNYGVPNNATTHNYTITLSQNEILEALEAILDKSPRPEVSKPVSSLLRELLTPKSD